MPIFCPTSAIGFILASRAISMSDLTAIGSLLGNELGRNLSGRLRRGWIEPVTHLEARRFGKLGCRDLLAVTPTHALGKDRPSPRGDRHALLADSNDLAGLARASDLGAVEYFDLLAIDNAPRTRCRIGSPDQIINLCNRLGPIDLGQVLLE